MEYNNKDIKIYQSSCDIELICELYQWAPHLYPTLSSLVSAFGDLSSKTVIFYVAVNHNTKLQTKIYYLANGNKNLLACYSFINLGLGKSCTG